MDKYSNFSELSQNETENKDGQGDYRIITYEGKDRNPNILILAPHGGSIEPFTSQIAKEIAKNDFNLYLFEGTKENSNFETLHITSTHFDEPKCIKLLKLSNIAIAIHGRSGSGEKILIGGRAQNIVEKIAQSLRKSDFLVEIATSGELSGTSIDNICNKTSTNEGVQIEIMRGLRNRLDENYKMLENFSKCIREVLI